MLVSFKEYTWSKSFGKQPITGNSNNSIKKDFKSLLGITPKLKVSKSIVIEST